MIVLSCTCGTFTKRLDRADLDDPDNLRAALTQHAEHTISCARRRAATERAS